MSAQLEDGYTRIADQILEEIPKYKLNGTQFSLLMVVWRYTYGFNRKDHEMSISFFQEATGICRSQIDRELTNLIELKVLIVTKESTHVHSRRLGFNKHFDEWGCQLKRGQSAKKRTVSEKEDGVSAKTGTGGVRELADQDIHSFKDNATTTGKDDFLKVSRAYGRIHGKYDVEPKYYPLLTKLLAAGMQPDMMIEVMEQKHREKTAAGETVSGFGYYEPVFKDRLNPKFKVYSGNRGVDWDAIEKQMKEAERGSKPGA